MIDRFFCSGFGCFTLCAGIIGTVGAVIGFAGYGLLHFAGLL